VLAVYTATIVQRPNQGSRHEEICLSHTEPITRERSGSLKVDGRSAEFRDIHQGPESLRQEWRARKRRGT
jgi:hypothetical protein